MARVSVEQQALTDYRIATLGHILGGDHRLGLGHMVYVWNACQERNTYTLSERDLAVISGIEHFASTLVEAGLGKKVKGGRIEIKGTRGRIEWLAKARANGTKGGRPIEPHGSPKGLTTGLPSGSRSNNPPTPAPALTLETEEKIPPKAPQDDGEGDGSLKPYPETRKALSAFPGETPTQAKMLELLNLVAKRGDAIAAAIVRDVADRARTPGSGIKSPMGILLYELRTRKEAPPARKSAAASIEGFASSDEATLAAWRPLVDAWIRQHGKPETWDDKVALWEEAGVDWTYYTQLTEGAAN